MNQRNGIIILIVIGLMSVAVYSWMVMHTENVPVSAPELTEVMPSIDKDSSTVPHPDVPFTSSDFVLPLDRAVERVTKKPFGVLIVPQTSPVQPERFHGYHTGVDFEIFSDELNIDMPVKAVCDGRLLLKKTAGGYGGVVVESCVADGTPITVVYGHLKLASITASVGKSVAAGERLGLLGADQSIETGGERKHLHLAFHQGADVNILGYVQNKTALDGWLDPCRFVCGK